MHRQADKARFAMSKVAATKQRQTNYVQEPKAGTRESFRCLVAKLKNPNSNRWSKGSATDLPATSCDGQATRGQSKYTWMKSPSTFKESRGLAACQVSASFFPILTFDNDTAELHTTSMLTVLPPKGNIMDPQS